MNTVELPDPVLFISQYTIYGYPDHDSINSSLFEVTVEYRGSGKWAVCWQGRCYDRNGVADYEPIPSSRTERWLKRFRFDDHIKAIDVARKVVGTLVVNGRNAAQVWAWERSLPKAAS